MSMLIIASFIHRCEDDSNGHSISPVAVRGVCKWAQPHRAATEVGSTLTVHSQQIFNVEFFWKLCIYFQKMLRWFYLLAIVEI